MGGSDAAQKASRSPREPASSSCKWKSIKCDFRTGVCMKIPASSLVQIIAKHFIVCCITKRKLWLTSPIVFSVSVIVAPLDELASYFHNFFIKL